MSRFRLAIGLHNHQPIGNFDFVFEQAHQQAYRPFLDLLSRHPRISISLHQSGILWDWQEKHQPEYLEQVKRVVSGHQLELMTGGFYEPILTSIPERDLHGQIALLTRYLEKHFGRQPHGLWLTERVWEPHLPKVLARSGVTFLPVDDTHFIFAGLEHAQLTGPFVTEFEGYSVKLLPIQKRLRYLIPFGKVEDVIAELRRQAEKNPGGVAVYADDGEKFGVWPNTYKHCYEDGWLYRFFEALERNADWLEVVPLGVAASMHPVGRVYLPSASYEEMGHWALPTPAFIQYEQFEQQLAETKQADQYGRFVRAGHWRGFLSKYDESNLMHKKMLQLSDRLAEYESRHPEQANALAEIRDRLYASQCNCPYWHGVFGGLYLPHIRQAVYSAMIDAEAKLRALSGATGVTVSVLDLDIDHTNEILVESNGYCALFKPDCGGMLIDLSLSKHAFNLTDTLMRRREGYHRKLAQAHTGNTGDSTASIHDLVISKEPGLEKLLVEDKYLKRCFIDHFLPEGSSIDEFKMAKSDELGDFVQGQYQYETEQRGLVTLLRNGTVRNGDRHHAVRITKSFLCDPVTERIDVTYELSTTDHSEFNCRFAIENNFTFQAGHADDRYLLIDSRRPQESFLDSVGAHPESHRITMVDEWRGLAVAVSARESAEIWHHPIYTVSLSEGGFEKVYQGTTLVHLFALNLSSQPTRLSLTLLAGTIAQVNSTPDVRSSVGSA